MIRPAARNATRRLRYCRRPLQVRDRKAAATAALAAVLLVTGSALAGISAPRVIYTDPDTRQAGPTPIQAYAALDCSAAETIVLTAALSETEREGDTTTGAWLANDYDCRLWSEWGPEIVYRLEVTEDLQLWAGLSGLGLNDLDVFLLSDCDAATCIAGANNELQVLLPAGVYWLVVDGYGTTTPAAGPYVLTLRTRWPGVPPQVCEAGGASAVACAGAIVTGEGNLTGAPDLMQSYDCSPSFVTGGEIWYAVTVPGIQKVTIRATPDAFSPALDVALWMFDGCGADAACLGFADLKAGGQPETVAFDNTTADPVTFYLAVDCRLAPAPDAGGYSIDFQCQDNVATEQMPLGSVRALFR